ncbi:hypothetical protein IDC16_001470 [Salmonella enterica subsp. enterica serovar Agbeni]|nr:hypothetical protein [Salmonella enterica subsp. enterica serovar Agbeni]EBW3019727.1 hypothetical protein [Salmonella enterica subsp. enterica serovar Agbeni]EBX0811181.1 hypothetical protein [Salmonella enterica subsp. enterica serovar Agbeni]EBX3308049.1 hypothetical protein [Salmonella enterica subsp. enterica serovar Agbeni]EBX7669416.1 hypothetical protein [Salmonella enterica subsp. enterica serovar Agbeni]
MEKLLQQEHQDLESVMNTLSFDNAVAYIEQYRFERVSEGMREIIINEAHSEALELNEEINYHDAIADFTWEMQSEDWRDFFTVMDEALEMNVAFLGGVARDEGRCEKLLQQSNQVCANIARMRAGWYFRNFRNVSDEQLHRFQNAVERLCGNDTTGTWFDLWLNAEGELVARSFEVIGNGN